MKDYNKISNLDSLEKEIHLLDLESKLIEEKLNRNINHLQKNGLSMTLNSIFCNEGKAKDQGKGFWESFFRTKGFNDTVHRFSETIVEKAAGAFADIAEKFLHKKER